MAERPSDVDGMCRDPDPIAALDRAGWPDAQIGKVDSENWLRVPGEVYVGRAARHRDPAKPYVTRDRVWYFGSRQSSSPMTVSRVSAAASTSVSSI